MNSWDTVRQGFRGKLSDFVQRWLPSFKDVLSSRARDGDRLRSATIEDAMAAHEIATALHYSRQTTPTAGFLVYDFTLPTFLEHVARGTLYTYKHRGEVWGYMILLEWNSDLMEPTRRILNEVKDFQVDLASLGTLTWIEQVAVHPDHVRRGVGSAMYGDLFSWNQDHTFACALAELPVPNDASRIFHQKKGFARMGTFTAEEFCGLKPYQSGIYVRLKKDKR
jgi:GNAT superfamily N-acetyltransferase